jgi:hypothetical protein
MTGLNSRYLFPPLLYSNASWKTNFIAFFKCFNKSCVLRLLSMKETCQNLVRSVVQREDLHIEKENTGKENRMLNWVIWAGYGLETSVIVGMSSDQFYEWKPTLKWRKFFWTGNSVKCNVYILAMKINRTLWLIEVMNLFRSWIHRRKYIFICITNILNGC